MMKWGTPILGTPQIININEDASKILSEVCQIFKFQKPAHVLCPEGQKKVFGAEAACLQGIL